MEGTERWHRECRARYNGSENDKTDGCVEILKRQGKIKQKHEKEESEWLERSIKEKKQMTRRIWRLRNG